MRSSGKKRGLAIFTLGALALSGLALAPADARTIGQGQAGVQLYTAELAGGYTNQFDGRNTSVQLYAGVDDSIAGQNTVRFSYLKGATQVNIATVPLFTGQATANWVAPSGPEGLAITDIRAEVLDVNGNPIPLAVDTNPVVGTATPNIGYLPVSIDANDRDEVGLSPDGEVVVTGKTREGVFGVGDAFPSTLVINSGPVTASPGFGVFAYSTDDADINDLTPYAAIVPVEAANLTGDAIDEIVVQTRIFAQGDDTRTLSVYDQSVSAVTQATAPGFPATVAGGPLDEHTRWVITVKDQKGNPVSGLDVYESNVTGDNLAGPDGMGRLVDNSNVFDTGETDHNGQLTVRLNECDTAGCPAGYGIDGVEDQDNFLHVGATYVTVDVNQDGNFDNGLDRILKLPISALPEGPATIDVESSLGPVMDADETTILTFTVKDSNGDPIQDANLNGTITRDRADNAPADNTEPLPAIPATDPSGQTQIAIQPGENNEAIDATIDVQSGAATGHLEIETDEALVTWDEYPTSQALATTTTTESARVALPSGSALPGRTVGTTLQHPSGGNSEIAPQAEQPAGTQTGTPLTASSTTDADGRYAVKVNDPALPDGQELDNVLMGSADHLATGFNIDPADCPPLVAGLPPCLSLDLDWLRTLTPTRVEIHNDINGTTADGLVPGLGGGLRPGGAGIGEVVAFNADDEQLDDIDVNLTIDQGSFVAYDDPFENVAIGAPVDWKSAGSSITVNTGEVIVGQGAIIDTRGAFLANIERHVGFDDDGRVEDEIHATAGAATDEHDLTWTTIGNPVNPRATDPLVVELSADQESSVLPKARAGNTALADGIPGDGSGQVVDYDVNTYDQFGNRTQQNTNETDNTPLAGFVGTGQSDFDLNQPSISAFAGAAMDQSIEVELEGPTTFTYTDDPADSSFDPNDPLANIGSNPVVVEDNTDAVNWYDVDLVTSTFTLGQQGPNTVPVGTSVTEVLGAIDQEGQPIENLIVDFLRGGPGSEDDDSCNEDFLEVCQVTDGNGQAFYDFAGGSVGTATVSAVVYSAEGVRLGTVGPDTVRFGPIEPIRATLTGRNAKNNKDRLKVNAPSIAAQASVRLLRKIDGEWKQVGRTRTLNAFGNKVFKVKDRNGKKVTKYQAKISSTITTNKDTTNVVKQK